ncbi:MAG: hypothetical protein JXA51_01020 [Dehalococcoidales bacterium]|nr:hypothetical protein [Dehalococcoidales bacterium]
MAKRLVIVAILLLFLLASVCSCLGSGPAPVAQLAILRQELTKDETGATVVYVTVKNNSQNVAELAEVSVDFYDASKNYVDSATDSVINLRPNETWDFTFRCEGERCSDVTSAEVRTTSGTISGGL